MTKEKPEPANSREALLDATEALMRESGYAAVTSRQVAAKAGLKPQLVHYYFDTMDDLFLAAFHRLANGIIERQSAIESSERPLRDMWTLLTDSRFRLLISEFVALGNHRPKIRAEFIEFGERVRKQQIAVMSRVLADKHLPEFPWSPAFAAILLHSLARFLATEDELGVTEGHAEAQSVVEWYIHRYDGVQPHLENRLRALEAENAQLRRRLEGKS